MPDAPAKIVIVDDSALMRKLLSAALEEAPDLTVVGAASDPYEARAVIKATNPDVVTLDVEMPKMDGLEFLRKIMQLRPTPVVMVASATERSAEATIAALEIGAVDYVTKPSGGENWREFGVALRQRIRAAAKVRFAPAPALGRGVAREPCAARAAPQSHDLVAIGASTGGVGAIIKLITELPPGMPPVAIVQHMPKDFTPRFADRLRRTTGLDVAEAEEGEALAPGAIRIAPGDRHMRLRRVAGRLVTTLDQLPPESGHRPSVDALFHSAAEVVGQRSVGVILTGMGRDGAAGLLAMRVAGAATVGEAAESCVVYGMSRVARELGAVDFELQLGQIPACLQNIIWGSKAPLRKPLQIRGNLNARREIPEDSGR